jgi:hypothetical protein
MQLSIFFFQTKYKDLLYIEISKAVSRKSMDKSVLYIQKWMSYPVVMQQAHRMFKVNVQSNR